MNKEDMNIAMACNGITVKIVIFMLKIITVINEDNTAFLKLLLLNLKIFEKM